MTLAEKKAEIVEAFSLYEEWLDKYEYLIELGKDLPPYPEEKKTEDRLIKGCQSRVWLDAQLRDGRLFFTADSDAIITKGIISLLIDVYSGRTPQEIAADDFAFIETAKSLRAASAADDDLRQTSTTRANWTRSKSSNFSR